MYNKRVIKSLISFICSENNQCSKSELQEKVKDKFSLYKFRSTFFCDDFAIKFSEQKKSKSNTVVALSTLMEFDNIPFIVCEVTPVGNNLILANTTFLEKISQSSAGLSADHIVGSFNAPNIIRNYMGIENSPENFEHLFKMHEKKTRQENLKRLVEATNGIEPVGKRFIPTSDELDIIRQSVQRASDFMKSTDYNVIKHILDRRLDCALRDINISFSGIDNNAIRGKTIENYITEGVENKNGLGDLYFESYGYYTAVDVKTVRYGVDTNPKGYNIDKLLSFLACENTVYVTYLLVYHPTGISSVLYSMFDESALPPNIYIDGRLSGRGSRGTVFYKGTMIENIMENFRRNVDISGGKAFIENLLRL